MRRLLLLTSFALLGVVIWAMPAQAFSPFLSTFSSTYPGSTSDNAASCQLCHATTGTSQWNAYGFALLQNGAGANISAALAAVEALNSDMDAGGSTNLDEIIANTQPGWCDPLFAGCTNLAFASDGTTTPATPPPGLALDPAVVPDPPNIACAPSALDFGNVTEGGTPAEDMVTCSNNGGSDLTVSTTLTGSMDFTIETDLPATIAPNTSADIVMSYGPLSAGPDAGSLVIDSNDPDTPTVTVSLAGTGIALPPVPQCVIAVAPTTLDFGTLTVGGNASLSVTVGNNDPDATCDVTAVLGGSPDFDASPLSFTVAPSGSQTVSVTYTASDAGADAGTLDVNSNDPDTPTVTVSLTGAGQAVPPPGDPNIACAPLSLDFGNVTEGGTPAEDMVTCSNTGGSDLTVSTTLTGSADFVIETDLPATIAPNASADMVVSYGPLSAGPDSGSLAIDSNDPDTPTVTVSLAGTGLPVLPAECDIAVAPTALDFGTLTVGDNASLSVTVGNNSMDTACDVIAMLGGSTDFDASPLSFTVAPTMSETVSVTYTASGAGADAGTLDVNSNDPDTPTVTVSLLGAGQAVPPPGDPGLVLYNNNCVFCHGDPWSAGPAMPRKVPGARECLIVASIDGNPAAQDDDDDDDRRHRDDGDEDDTPFPNGVPAMGFLKGMFNDQQIFDISDYLNSNPTSGEMRYITTCAGCHGLDAAGGFVDEDVRGDDAEDVAEAIHDEEVMEFLDCLPESDIVQIGGYLEMLDEDDDDDDDDDDDWWRRRHWTSAH